MKEITKEQIKYIKQLHQKKYRDEHGAFIVEGEKGVKDAIESGANIRYIVVSKKFDLDIAKEKIYSIKDGKVISSVKTWPGIMAVISKEKEQELKGDTIVALYKINDPGNLGTIIRTCHWFGIKNILLSEDSVDPYNEKVVRASMGSFFSVHIKVSDDFSKEIEAYKKQGYFVSAYNAEGQKKELSNKEKHLILFGSESHGLSEKTLKLADEQVKIQGDSQLDSLNLAVSVGIALNMKASS